MQANETRVRDVRVAYRPTDILNAVRQPRQPIQVVKEGKTGALGVSIGGSLPSGFNGQVDTVLATLPALFPEWLGDRSFTEIHGVRFPYASGAMANGIASPRLVIEMARAGFLSFFGAAGLSPESVATSLDEIEEALGSSASWGANLIHSPNEPAVEAAVADLYIRRGVRRVSAAAYMGLTPPIVRYAASGLSRDPQGRIVRINHVFAKVSRPEVARHFLEPPSRPMLEALVASGELTQTEAELAAGLPVAEDITVESDSGGHTDNRPLTALFPTMMALRDSIVAERDYERPIRIGAAGGLGTPGAVAAAFTLGAAFVVTGSVNQACVESGLGAEGKAMLAGADVADVVMAPAADMFEMGVDVQVLKRGTMFGVRARKLYELYRSHGSLSEIPDVERQRLERDYFRVPLEQEWSDARAFWMDRDPSEVERADRDPKHQMALVFRAYLGKASRWAINGISDRRADYQIWCGPAMGAFNAWVKGSFLEKPANRTVTQVARNLMEGAAVVTRAQQLRTFGVPIPAAAFDFRPRPLA